MSWRWSSGWVDCWVCRRLGSWSERREEEEGEGRGGEEKVQKEEERHPESLNYIISSPKERYRSSTQWSASLGSQTLPGIFGIMFGCVIYTTNHVLLWLHLHTLCTLMVHGTLQHLEILEGYFKISTVNIHFWLIWLTLRHYQKAS